MFQSLRRLFRKKPPASLKPRQERDPVRYEAERAKASSTSAKDRVKLAKSPQTHLEILYYLAEDQDDSVRLAVAKNPSTPIQASEIIARDKSIDVRMALAKRLMALLPNLTEEQHSHLYAYAAQALGVLALDEVLKIRLALSSVLKDRADAPPQVVSRLARDIEREVSEPILRFCTALPDNDLLEILMEHPKDWVAQAIAGRKKVSAPVAAAVIEHGDVKAGAMLIGNEGAVITDDIFAKIVDRAATTPEWHMPLCLRKHLPAPLMREIVLFVDASLHKFLFARTDFDPDMKVEIEGLVKRRMRFLMDDQGRRIDPEEKAVRLHKAGMLDDEVIADALALREHDFILLALSLKSGLKLDIARRMVETKAPKAITALAWKAGLAMRTAFALQRDMARVPHNELLYPRGGTDFPMTEMDMQWQLDFFAGGK